MSINQPDLNKQFDINNNQLDIEELVQTLIQYKDINDIQLYDYYDVSYIIQTMDRSKLIDIEKLFKAQQSVDIVLFVRILLQVIQHRQDETLYLAMALIDLFQEISESKGVTTVLQFKDFSNRVCDKLLDRNIAGYQILTKKMPEPKKFNVNSDYVRQIDLEAPKLYGENNDNLKRLVQSKLKTDNLHHVNQRVKCASYAKEINKLICLDSLAERINIFNLDISLMKEIKPHQNYPKEERKDTLIFGVAWSQKQLRIGATLKDLTLCFWDSSDNFTFEKSFQIQNYTTEYQNNIWFLENLNCWITSDNKKCVIYVWNIESETLEQTIESPRIKHTIVEVVELVTLKLVAVASLDKIITIWNFKKAQLIQSIEIPKAGIHSLVYSHNYQVILSAGYENNINIFQIDPVYFDTFQVGKLIGHSSMVTALQIIENTPMIISADDFGAIKVWDIRTLKCIQTINYGERTIITKLLDCFVQGKICFVGSRLNMIDFNQSSQIKEKFKRPEPAYAIKIELNQLKSELYICTRKDVRIYNLMNGRLKYIYAGILDDEEEEITAFKSIDQNSKFIVGNNKGEMWQFHTSNGEKLNKIGQHNHELTSLILDYQNKLLLTAGWDAVLKVQKITQTELIKVRSISNCFNRKEITIVELSAYHNLILTASNCEDLYVWDYEFFKLLSKISFKKGTDPSAITFLNGYALLVIASNDGMIYFLHFDKLENNLNFQYLATLNLEKIQKTVSSLREVTSCSIKPSQQFDYPLPSPKSQANQNVLNQSGSIKKSNQIGDSQQLSNNALQQFENDELDQDDISESSMDSKSNQEQNQQQQENEAEDSEKKNVVQKFITKLVIDCQYSEDNQKIVKCYLHAATNKGELVAFDISAIFDCYQLPFIPHANQKRNYNAYRGADEDFNEITKKSVIQNIKLRENMNLSNFTVKDKKISHMTKTKVRNLQQTLMFKVQAHKDLLTTMTLLNLKEQHIITSSLDQYVKIWKASNYELQGSFNINHPLPIMWAVQINPYSKAKQRVLFAIKVMDIIYKKFRSELSITEERSIRISEFLSNINKNMQIQLTTIMPSLTQVKKPSLASFGGNLNQNPSLISENNSLIMKNNNQSTKALSSTNINMGKSNSQKIIIMKDEYDPRDLKYEEIKQYFQQEIIGPSLKRMEANKRVALAQQVWKKDLKSQGDPIDNVAPLLDKINKQSKIYEEENLKTEEREALQNYLDPHYKEKVMKYIVKKNLFEDLPSKNQKEFMAKLDNITLQNQKKAQNKEKPRNTIFIDTPLKIPISQATDQTQTQSVVQEQKSPQQQPQIQSQQNVSISQSQDPQKQQQQLQQQQQQVYEESKMSQCKDYFKYALEKNIIQSQNTQNSSSINLSNIDQTTLTASVSEINVSKSQHDTQISSSTQSKVNKVLQGINIKLKKAQQTFKGLNSLDEFMQSREKIKKQIQQIQRKEYEENGRYLKQNSLSLAGLNLLKMQISLPKLNNNNNYSILSGSQRNLQSKYINQTQESIPLSKMNQNTVNSTLNFITDNDQQNNQQNISIIQNNGQQVSQQDNNMTQQETEYLPIVQSKYSQQKQKLASILGTSNF